MVKVILISMVSIVGPIAVMNLPNGAGGAVFALLQTSINSIGPHVGVTILPPAEPSIVGPSDSVNSFFLKFLSPTFAFLSFIACAFFLL